MLVRLMYNIWYFVTFCHIYPRLFALTATHCRSLPHTLMHEYLRGNEKSPHHLAITILPHCAITLSHFCQTHGHVVAPSHLHVVTLSPTDVVGLLHTNTGNWGLFPWRCIASQQKTLSYTWLSPLMHSVPCQMYGRSGPAVPLHIRMFRKKLGIFLLLGKLFAIILHYSVTIITTWDRWSSNHSQVEKYRL